MANGHGGARPGAGTKPGHYTPPAARVDFEEARARKEAARAELTEIAVRKQRGEVVPRVDVQQASATALAVLAHSLRAIPDNLERRHGVDPATAQVIGDEIDRALGICADAFERMHKAAVAEIEADDVSDLL